MSKAIILCLGLSFAVTPHSFAADGAMKKLQRGIVNVVTAPLEVPKQIRAYWIAGSEKTLHISAWVFCGFVKGLWMTPLRMGSGLWDIITWPFVEATRRVASTKNDTGLIQPEYVFDDWPKRKKGVVYKNLWDRD